MSCKAYSSPGGLVAGTQCQGSNGPLPCQLLLAEALPQGPV